jgi:ubiquitin C-terminal hydrolase
MDVDQQSQVIQNDESPTVQLAPEDFEYKLVGVVIHMGTADAGHYLSYINIDRTSDSSVDTQEWLKTEN